MMNRYLARTLVILVVAAALPVVGLTSPADAKPINSVKDLKASCAKGNGAFISNAAGTFGVCATNGGDVVCDNTKNGNKCHVVSERERTETAKLLNLLNGFLLAPSTSGPGGGSGQPTTGGNPGGSGSTNTPGTKPTGTTTTTPRSTTTTKPNVIQ
jgi:hypothetical protein